MEIEGQYEDSRKCKAKSKQSGKRCNRWAVDGKRVCYMHGGAPGAGRPITHGRYSKALSQTCLSEAYRTAIEDKNLLDLREPIALLEACLQRTSERVGLADTPDFRKKALRIYEEMRVAINEGDGVSAARLDRELGELLETGVAEDRAISELSEQADRLAKRLEGVWTIRLQKKQVLNIQQLGVIISRIIEIVKQESTIEIASMIMRRLDAEVMSLPNASEVIELRGPSEEYVIPQESDKAQDA